MFTLYRIGFTPARKPHRIGLLFTHKDSDFGAISSHRANCAAPIADRKWTMKKLLSGFFMVLVYRGRSIFFVKYLGQTHGRGV